MHFHFPGILADDDSALIKLGIYVIIGVIWLISAMVKKAVKGMSSPQRPAPPPVPGQAPAGVWQPPPTAPSLPTPFRPPPMPKVKKKAAKRPAVVVAAPPAVVRAAPVQQAVEVMPARAVTGAAEAAPMAQMLRRELQPETLRREFLMLEILGKPLALRDGDGAAGGGAA